MIREVTLILFLFSVSQVHATKNSFYNHHSASDDSVITIKAVDSTKVYEIGKACLTCTVNVNTEDNLTLKEYHFENGDAVGYIFYEYGKRQALSSALIYNNGKLIERRNEYGKDPYDFRNTYKSTTYYDDGKIKAAGLVKRAYKNGVWNEYYGNGKMKTLTTYELDKKNGKYSEYYENGKIKITGSYNNDAMAGYWAEFDTSGTYAKSHTYDLLSQHGLSKADLKGCVTITKISNNENKIVANLKSGDRIAIEYSPGGKSLKNTALKAIRNDTIFVADVNILGVDKEIFSIPVSEITSVGYSWSLILPGGGVQGVYTSTTKTIWKHIQISDKDYSINFYDENCIERN